MQTNQKIFLAIGIIALIILIMNWDKVFGEKKFRRGGVGGRSMADCNHATCPNGHCECNDGDCKCVNPTN